MQPFLFPGDLFEQDSDAEPAWTCVRTRPRWEKRFARWLHGERMDHFLPVIGRRTRSHRKSRITEVPLFAGYVFVRGTFSKADFTRSDAVAYVLNPRSPQEARNVDDTLVAVWRMLADGRDVGIVDRLNPGEEVDVIAGPLMGTRGRFVREGSGGKLVVWIDLLGSGVSAEVEDASLVRRVG